MCVLNWWLLYLENRFSKASMLHGSWPPNQPTETLLSQECSQNLAPLPQSFVSIIVILTPSVSGAGQVSMGTGVDTETGSELQTENTVSLPVPRPDSHPPPSWFPGVHWRYFSCGGCTFPSGGIWSVFLPAAASWPHIGWRFMPASKHRMFLSASPASLLPVSSPPI